MKIKKFMNNTKKNTCKGLRKTISLEDKKYHEHDQEKQGANMQM